MSVSESYGGEGADGSARERASRLPEELRALGRSLDAPGAGGSESMVERVLEQILAERLPVPAPEPPGAAERLRTVRHWTRTRWRTLTAPLCGLLAVLALSVSPSAFSLTLSLFLLMAVVIGGLGSLEGALVGALIVSALRTITIQFWEEIELAALYLIAAVVLLIRPTGLFGRKA
jgi:hypothetical protein